jgi:two-component system response regulator FixJ
MPNELLVHVVDGADADRKSISLFLNDIGIQSQTYASAEVLLSEFPNMRSGCVVTAVRLPGRSGLDLLAELAEPRRGVSVIVVSDDGDVSLAVEAMKRGADDFLVKPLDRDVFLRAVQNGVARAVAADHHALERADASERIGRLSRREREVLCGLVDGKPNKVIAFELNISPRTVEIYRANIMHKVQVASVSKLVQLTLLAGQSQSLR